MSTVKQFGKFDGELFFDHRLRAHGIKISLGNTTSEQRIERIRGAILQCRLEHVTVRRPDGLSETWGEAFRRFFNQPLTPTTSGE